MLKPDAFLHAETYLRRHEQTMRLALEEERSALVIPAVYGFALEHFEPLVHEVSKVVPTPPETSRLSTELGNGADECLINPQLEGALPMRGSEKGKMSRIDRLFLPIDGGFLKVTTRAGTTAAASGNVLMAVTNYDYANRAETADYIEARAWFGHRIEPDAAIFVPRRTFRYEQDAGPESLFSCSYQEWDKPDERVAIYSSDARPPQPEQLATLQTAFLRESRVALTGLLSVVVR